MGRDLGVEGSKGIIQYSETEKELPSSYRRPEGQILINESEFRLQYAKRSPDIPHEARFAQQLDSAVQIGFLDLLGERYYGTGAMDASERLIGYSPYVGGFMAELAGTGPLVTTGVVAGVYAIAAGIDYYDARLAMKNTRPLAVLKLKRWSMAPCGVPIERRIEALTRSTSSLKKNAKPKIVRYLPDLE